MASEFKKKIFWRAVVAEFLAMTLFIFISIGSALGFQYPVRNNQTSGAAQDNVKVSLAFGLSIATLAQSVGHISGAHLNPAVTLGLLLSCQISVLRAVMYIIAQCVGAIVATAILSGITSSLPGNSLGLNSLAPGVNSGQGLGIEIIGTLQLVLCVLATTDRRRRDLGGSAPLAIGFSVALGHLLAVSGGPSQVGVGRAEPGRCPVEDSGWDLDRAHSTGWGDQLPVRGMPRDRPTIFLSLFVPSLFPPLSSLSISPCHPLASSPSACFSVSCPARCPHPDRLHRLRH
uniref:Aquaporin-1 n=1 Tax=Sus scrofa TaxID=9823 RepID=A0A8D0V6F3_PIG